MLSDDRLLDLLTARATEGLSAVESEPLPEGVKRRIRLPGIEPPN